MDKKHWYEKFHIWVGIIGGILGSVVSLLTIIGHFNNSNKANKNNQILIKPTIDPTLDETSTSSETKEQEEIYTEYAQVTSEILEVKRRPEQDSKIIATASKGDTFWVLKKIKDEDGHDLWYKVVGGEIRGYIVAENTNLYKLIKEDKE